MNLNYTTHIIESFQDCSLSGILLIDDAYDIPDLVEDRVGDLMDVLEDADLRKYLKEEVFSDTDRKAAIESLEVSDMYSSYVTNAMHSLYYAYIENRSTTLDPGGMFSTLKGAALDALDPLVELLKLCAPADQVWKIGKNDAVSMYKQKRPDLILMDYYLSPQKRTVRALTKGESDADRVRSINTLEHILKESDVVIPAVVLMSSGDVSDRSTKAYRRRFKGRVTAFRFGFLNKNWITGSGTAIEASGKAADVLMETSGSFEFGRALEAALRLWKVGAKAGLDKLYDELKDFDVKDFAYLLRFRLYQEEEPFADYLEWFLGESLRAIVDDEVEWSAENFVQLNEPKLTEKIEGAHPIPSSLLAEFFNRLRFNSRKSRERNRYALGDFFVALNGKDARMVITPDCDLIPRKTRPKASRLLTIGGKIQGLEERNAFAGELIFHNSPKWIKWNYKDLMTHEFEDISALNVGEVSYKYFGTLRSMAAQTIQKNALADLSHVGISVPPTVDVGAPVKVFVKKDLGSESPMEQIIGLSETYVQVMIPRGGKDLHKRALFAPSFLRELVARVQKMDEKELLKDHRQHRRNWIDGKARVQRVMLNEGLKLEDGDGLFGMMAYVSNTRNKNWLEIVVDVTEGALIELQDTDPLTD